MKKQQKARVLTALFSELNRIFFDDRLPRYRLRWTHFNTNSGTCQYGECFPEKETILIQRGLTGDELRQALLHEMCHIRSIGHGKRFQAKLAHLASLGEQWAEEQRAGYEEACQFSLSTTANIRHIIQDWTGQCADIPWIQIRRLLAREVGLSPNHLIKTAPWVRRVWQREVAAWRTHERNWEILKAKISQETPPTRNS